MRPLFRSLHAPIRRGAGNVDSAAGPGCGTKRADRSPPGKLLMLERKPMDRDLAGRLSCVVCGIETKRHAGWFLLMDNCWLDRVRVLSWHPVLAHEGKMRAVCGKQHLKTLLTHWLNHANLQLVASGASPWPPALDTSLSLSSYS